MPVAVWITIPLQRPKMDISNMGPILVFLIIYINCVSGLEDPQPADLRVDIVDGEVIAIWKHPEGAPPNYHYNVQMGKYSGDWNEVTSCKETTKTNCDLTNLIDDYRTRYKVKVQLVAGDHVSAWTIKKFLPNKSDLLPPSFTLWATSSTLTVYVHQKAILKDLFPLGVTYTIYLEDRGKDNKTTTAYVEDDAEEDQRSKTFKSLHWGRKYCVSIKVEGNGALSSSSVSPKQCLQLPEQEWFIIAVSSLSILGVLTLFAFMASILLCYLRLPGKTPTALKSPVSGWLPLSVGEGTIEVVTDKGWFLSSYKTEVKSCVKVPVTHITVTEDNGEEDRRTSMDSGVGMESNSATKSGGSPPVRQEDSGCGSLGGTESLTSSQTDYPLQEETTDTDTVRKREDSGLGCQLHSSSMNLDGQDSGSLKQAVVGGNYRTQSPAAVQINVSDDEEFKQMLPNAALAEVVTGYRAGPQSCICSGAGQCTWCHKQDLSGTGAIKEYRSVCIDNRLLTGKWDFVDSYKGVLTFPSYSKTTQMDMMDDLETTLIQLGDTFPLLTGLTPLPKVEGGQDFNMNNVSISLCDVQLTTD